MKRKITVRKGTKKDINAVLRLIVESWHSQFAASLDYLWGTETKAGTVRELRDYLTNKLSDYPNPQTWIAFCDGRPAGAISCGTHGGKFWLWELFVKREYRGLGVGEKLVDAALKGRRSVYLDVNSRNPAVKFWKKMGFKPVVSSLVMVRE